VVGGQVALDGSGSPENSGDLRAQLINATEKGIVALRDQAATTDRILKVVIYCVLQDDLTPEDVQAVVLNALETQSTPVITLVPVPHFPEPGILASVEFTASKQAGTATPKVEPITIDTHHCGAGHHGIRAGRFIFTDAQMAVDPHGEVEFPGDIVNQSRVTMDRIATVLSHYGASLDDAVKFNIYYVGEGTYEDWETAAKIRASYFTEPGPVATGIPVPHLERPGLLIKMEVWAMLGTNGQQLERTHVWPENHWDWAIHLPYKHGLKCEDMFFIGGQIATDSEGVVMHPGNTEAQVAQCLTYIDRVINLLPDVERHHIAKTTTFYTGDCDREVHDLNAIPRSDWFAPAQPVTTEVALPALAFEDMMTEIEVLGSTIE
jgi:enamine deaminase RidA (YjgF/YER057c/UK114 family)